MRYNHETRHADLAGAECRACHNVGARMEVVTEVGSPHFAKLICLACDRFIEWVSLPPEIKDDSQDRKRSRRQVKNLGDRCEICLRHKDELPAPEKLEVHHAVEKAADGSDAVDNLRLYCTACHRLVNWARTHFGHYHPS